MEIIRFNNKEYSVDIEKCIKSGYMKPKENEYIDLGLPSGTLWASENVDNNYYTHGEAIEKFGKQLPTRTQFCELIDYTKHEWDEDKKGMWFIGKNGNKIFLSALGYKREGKFYDAFSDGYFWTDTSDSVRYAWYFNFSLDNIDAGSIRRDSEFSIRLVKDNLK